MTIDNKELAHYAANYATTSGIIVTNKNGDVKHAPFSLYPTKFPKSEFTKAYGVQEIVNTLQHKVSLDKEFLNDVLKEAVKNDVFTKKLLDIYNDFYEHNSTKPVLGIHRSDYMLDGKNKAKQVEVNTIAASFGSLGTKTTEMHRLLSERFLNQQQSEHLPINNALTGIAKALKHGHSQYIETNGNNNLCAIVMVTLPNENNSFDQNWLEYTLFQTEKVKLIRRSLKDINDRASLDEKGKMTIDGYEVSVAYFRSGYSPDQYPTDDEWKARILIEKSQAISCPSVAYQLTGTKKVQQTLSDITILKKFISDDESAKRLSETFTGLYATTDTAVKAALENPEAFVLKPQREGGGNNLYENEMVSALEKMNETERTEFILMDRIVSNPIDGFIVREGEYTAYKLVSELGIFGYYLTDENGKVKANETIGHLLRSKPANENDGGVAAGVAVLDSPCLY